MFEASLKRIIKRGMIAMEGIEFGRIRVFLALVLEGTTESLEKAIAGLKNNSEIRISYMKASVDRPKVVFPREAEQK